VESTRLVLVHFQFNAWVEEILIRHWAFESHSPPLMAKGHRKDNLAKARKLWHNTPDNNPNSQPLEMDSESDCGYEGGVNCDSTDNEYDPQEIPLWQLWLHFQHFEGEHAESLEVRAVANYPAVGTPNVSMDGCIQGRYGDNGCCKGNLTNLRRELHLSLAKGNPK
jgi:hypothetical protein